MEIDHLGGFLGGHEAATEKLGLLESSCCQGNTDDSPNKCCEVQGDPRKIIGRFCLLGMRRHVPKDLPMTGRIRQPHDSPLDIPAGILYTSP